MTRAFACTTPARAELTRLRDPAPPASLRDRAAARLKVAAGMAVARWPARKSLDLGHPAGGLSRAVGTH
jgi:hypothetical protein